MNDIRPIIHSATLHRNAARGSEHMEVGYPENDLSATWVGDLLAAIRRQAIKLTLWILICFGISLGYVLTASREYVASAQIALEPRVRPPAGAGDASAIAASLDSAQAESQLQIVRSVRNLRYVFDTLNLASDPMFAPAPGLVGRLIGDIINLLGWSDRSRSSAGHLIDHASEFAFQNFADRVQVRRLGQSYVIEVSFRGPQPETTARITNSIAASYIRDQVLVRASSEQRGTEFLQGRISLIQAEKKAADEAVASGVITSYEFPDADARIVGAALKPLAASYPQTKLVLLFGIVAGLVTGVAFIALISNFDQTVRSPTQIRRALGIDCLAVVPRLEPAIMSALSALEEPGSGFSQSIRRLRNILFAARPKAQPVAIGFVSCEEGDGCSAVTANLAALLAASNERVVLIDACFQKPDLTRRLAPDSQVGLDQFILSPSDTSTLPELKLASSLSFVPAVAKGHVADPNTFLGTQAVRKLFEQYDETAEIILDLPPLEVSSDAQAVGGMLAGVVLVAAVNRTKLDQLSSAIRALRLADCHIIGLVLNDPAPRRYAGRHFF